MTEALPEPQLRLPEAAVGLWRLELGIVCAGLFVGSLVLAAMAGEVGLPAWIPPAVVVVLAIPALAFVPRLRWRRWRYDVRDDEIDLRSGLWTIQRTLVPIRRVQHVDTESGPLEGAFDLASVTFHTAAGATGIPALTRSEAERVRARVAELARTRDDV